MIFDKWNIKSKRYRNIHVIPVNDLREHRESQRCWCKPQILLGAGKTKIVVHNSKDGRELIEEHGVN